MSTFSKSSEVGGGAGQFKPGERINREVELGVTFSRTETDIFELSPVEGPTLGQHIDKLLRQNLLAANADARAELITELNIKLR